MKIKELENIEILFQNDDFVAINKPHGMLVHKTRIAKDAKIFALQELRNQLGKYVYPVHRLDRKTSGVLIFALNKNAQTALNRLFEERNIKKTYLAIVRGSIADAGIVNYELSNDRGILQSAITHYLPIEHFEIPLPSGKHETSRYTFLKLHPETGRMHQLRKHMAHIFHPIIGDRPHGCNKQNRMWKETWNMDKMLLHASEITFELRDQHFTIEAPLSSSFTQSINMLRSFDV